MISNYLNTKKILFYLGFAGAVIGLYAGSQLYRTNKHSVHNVPVVNRVINEQEAAQEQVVKKDNSLYYKAYQDTLSTDWYQDFRKQRGLVKASEKTTQKAREFLEILNVPMPEIITIYNAKRSCSSAYDVWINEKTITCLDFVLAHECSHIALNHWYTKMKNRLSLEELRVLEREADLSACKLLYDLGNLEGLYQQIGWLEYFAHSGLQTPAQAAADEHPPVLEEIEVMKNFLVEQGISLDEINASVKPHREYYEKTHKK